VTAEEHALYPREDLRHPVRCLPQQRLGIDFPGYGIPTREHASCDGVRHDLRQENLPFRRPFVFLIRARPSGPWGGGSRSRGPERRLDRVLAGQSRLDRRRLPHLKTRFEDPADHRRVRPREPSVQRNRTHGEPRFPRRPRVFERLWLTAAPGKIGTVAVTPHLSKPRD
jgi:hypothetical protein